jgi:peptide deformylase
MILPIYTEPNPVLHQRTSPIIEITDDIRQLADDMRDTMRGAQGIGLAAPQVGRTVSMIVVECADEDRGSFPLLTLLNPRITWKGTKRIEMEEGCLSIPGLEGPVSRPERVRVKAKDLEGNTVEIEADGLLSRVLQHEIDHLNGILFTSYVPKRRMHKRPLVEYPQI